VAVPLLRWSGGPWLHYWRAGKGCRSPASPERDEGSACLRVSLGHASSGFRTRSPRAAGSVTGGEAPVSSRAVRSELRRAASPQPGEAKAEGKGAWRERRGVRGGFPAALGKVKGKISPFFLKSLRCWELASYVTALPTASEGFGLSSETTFFFFFLFYSSHLSVLFLLGFPAGFPGF